MERSELDVNVTDNNGNTPLHIYANKGDTKAVKTILKHSMIYVNSINKNGETPISIAASRHFLSIVRMINKKINE